MGIIPTRGGKAQQEDILFNLRNQVDVQTCRAIPHAFVDDNGNCVLSVRREEDGTYTMKPVTYVGGGAPPPQVRPSET
jgi:hypothetical protein